MTDPKLTPPPELVHQWTAAACEEDENAWNYFATWAAQWGADQELEECCKVLESMLPNLGILPLVLRDARRPKPPSLKEQALAALDDAIMRGDCITISDALPTIRRAIEALPDD
jgi:hypothetical protein